MEIWKTNDLYKGCYDFSNYGRVYSVHQKRILKNVKPNKRGYIYRELIDNNGNSKTVAIHRVIAKIFIPNPDNLPEVNHIDENKLNNRADNLEWCDRKYNMNHATIKKRISKTNRNRKDLSKPVLQLTKSGEFVKEYPSVMEVSRQTGIQRRSIINCCLKKSHYNTAGGYIWRYK